MSLRLIGGKFKNHLIKTPAGLLTKPTMSMMRKSVFDICQADVAGSKFLDLFACSGAMGLEALSRGAGFATFIEKDRRSAKCIEENLHAMHLENQGKVLCGDALTLLKKLPTEKPLFNLVYIDPPYTLVKNPGCNPQQILEFFDTSSLLEKGTTLFLEEGFPSHLSIEKLHLTTLRFINSRKFSNSLLHQFYISL